jgi:hypothetical protein
MRLLRRTSAIQYGGFYRLEGGKAVGLQRVLRRGHYRQFQFAKRETVLSNNPNGRTGRRQFSSRKPATNDRKNIRTLMAETLAVKMVLSRVLARICGLDPVLAAAIHKGIQDAATELKPSSTKSGQSTSADPTIEALAIVDALRAVLIVNQATLL